MQSQQEVALLIGARARELADIAQACRLSLLSYLLKMAAQEADERAGPVSHRQPAGRTAKLRLEKPEPRRITLKRASGDQRGQSGNWSSETAKQ